jgi:type II secretory pathway pseudopilin PulG
MRKRQGYTLIELVVVLLLLILVAAAVFTLAGTGSRTYLRLASRQAQSADLRTGISYLDVQINKHDTRGALSIRPDPFAGQPALVIEQTLEGETYLTWIYVLDGYLCELFVSQDTALTPEMASKIVPMDSLRLEMPSADSIHVTLIRETEGLAQRQAERIIHLQAGGLGS